MQKKHLFLLIGYGLLIFLGYQYWQLNPEKTRIFVTSDFAAAQEKSGQVYALGKDKWAQTQPLGYLYSESAVIKASTIEAGKKAGQLTRWSEDFAVVTLDGYRVFWFGKNFTFSEIQKLPINFQSDIWILESVNPPAQIPLPQSAIAWQGVKKQPSKKLLERTMDTNVSFFSTQEQGHFWLTEKKGHWEPK